MKEHGRLDDLQKTKMAEVIQYVSRQVAGWRVYNDKRILSTDVVAHMKALLADSDQSDYDHFRPWKQEVTFVVGPWAAVIQALLVAPHLVKRKQSHRSHADGTSTVPSPTSQATLVFEGTVPEIRIAAERIARIPPDSVLEIELTSKKDPRLTSEQMVKFEALQECHQNYLHEIGVRKCPPTVPANLQPKGRYLTPKGEGGKWNHYQPVLNMQMNGSRLGVCA
jgi:hypothetical protein